MARQKPDTSFNFGANAKRRPAATSRLRKAASSFREGGKGGSNSGGGSIKA